MLKQSTKAAGCTAEIPHASPFNKLARIASTNISTPTVLLSQISAAGLVLASAGLGAVYAWTTGSQHGVGLAGLMVLMAVALEIAKPLSLASAFTAFRSWGLVRGAALALLAAVAVVYSLTAELTLMAGARGDAVAKREAALKANTNADDEAQRVKGRYEAAKAELKTLPPARPAGELQAEIDAINRMPGIVIDGAPCGGLLNGKVSREWCPKRSALIAEKARAERRAGLEAVMAQPLPVATTTAGAPQVKDADPGASALHTYLAALGFTIPAGLLTDWLALIPVLALEVGSALAGVLVQAISLARPQLASNRQVESVTEASATDPVGHVVHPQNTDDAATRERVKTAILDQLETRGGSVASSERGLAALIGASRPTVRRAINGLVLAGIVVAEATRNGTMLRLVS